MNNCTFIGNLTRDPEVKTTASGVTIARFTIAVQRRYKNKDTGNYDCDFIKCTAFRSSAEVVGKYFTKGNKIGIQGTLHTDSYEKDGVKIPSFEIWVDSVDFCTNSTNTKSAEQKPAKDDLDDFFDNLQPVDDTELPF